MAGTVTGNNTGPSLEVREISLDWYEVERTKEIMKHEGKCVYVLMPPGTTESVARNTLLFKTMDSMTKKIENVSMGEVEQALSAMNSEIKFLNRAKMFGTIEVKFQIEEAAKRHLLHNIKTEKW